VKKLNLINVERLARLSKNGDVKAKEELAKEGSSLSY